MTTNKRIPNKLISEKSPYLLQHSYNPVNWFPWSEEAFSKAELEDKPVFLSIGYSTCHWCHVMERESFEDQEVAEVLNSNFVCIKVDREERPDIDSIYMSVCQAVTGSGGWPLTIVMTPHKKPFYAGTYFPKKRRMGYPGIIEILEFINTEWKNNKNNLISASENITNILSKEEESLNDVALDDEVLAKAVKGYFNSFDENHGGFSTAPKFPTPHNLTFLLRHWKSTGNIHALHMVEKTLDSMYRGGIFDHIGFGFSRYSTDNKWLAPHFEKMLYDNALLAIVYLETYLATGKEQYARTVKQILEYISRDMTAPEGGFYSAEDADSEGVEGKFYLWSREDINNVLGIEDGKIFCEYFDITVKGNFEGKNIPNLIDNEHELSIGLPKHIEKMREKLFAERSKRIHPHKDDKVLTSWNGLMISAFAMAGKVLESKEYINIASRAVNFVQEKMVRDDGRLLARYRDGESAYPAYLDDYAFYVWGLIELYEATFDIQYLKSAIKFNQDMINIFFDKEKGGFYLYGSDSEQLIVRPKELYDGAIPSGNSVATMNLLRLSRITGNFELEDYVQKQFTYFSSVVERYPIGYAYFLMCIQFSQSKSSEIVVVGKKNEKNKEEMIELVNKTFLPYTVTIVKNMDVNNKELEEIIPHIEKQNMVDDKATAYICKNFACKSPITDINQFQESL